MASSLVVSTALLLSQAPAATGAADAPVLAEEMPYQGGPIPDGYELITEYNTQLLFFGWSIFSLGYTVAGVYGVIAGLYALPAFQRGDPFLALIPLAGPFLALGGPEYRDQLDPDARARHDVLMIGTGVVQLIGAAMTAGGYFFPRRVLRLKPQRPATLPPAGGALVPFGPRGSAGVTLSLSF